MTLINNKNVKELKYQLLNRCFKDYQKIENRFENLLKKSNNSYLLCTTKNNLLKSNVFYKVKKQNGYCFYKSLNTKTSDSYRILLNLFDKTNFKYVINMWHHQSLTFTIH